jgi:L-alanine-DL-glutamate epimerase-like enolase superfamily enzyme
MSDRPTDVRVLNVVATTESIPYRTPMKFGGRVVDSVTLLNVELTAENRGGGKAVGHGSMPLGVAWSWPTPALDGDTKLAAMVAFGHGVADITLGELSADYLDPLTASHQLSHGYRELSEKVRTALKLSEPPVKLAQLVAASPIVAALFDAYGKSAGQNAYRMLTAAHVRHDLAAYLDDRFAGEYLDQYLLQAPKASLPLYHLVGALDPLTNAELSQPVGDGLPETLEEWIRREGLTHLKIKLAGNDLDWDLSRVVAVSAIADAFAAARRKNAFQFSLDFNEQCDSVDYLLEFLRRLEEAAPRGYERTQYIEQPTHRDLARPGENRVHAAARLKPVVIDESLVDYESLLLARELGYSGVALKACKGQAEALLMGAAAQKFGMFLAVQDLTCPGRSLLHSASLAAWMPGVAGIESNGRQYCPLGNEAWKADYRGLFEIADGVAPTGLLSGAGLGC